MEIDDDVECGETRHKGQQIGGVVGSGHRAPVPARSFCPAAPAPSLSSGNGGKQKNADTSKPPYIKRREYRPIHVSPWKRYNDMMDSTCYYIAHDYDEVFEFIEEGNMNLDMPTRQAALGLSSSVVSVVSSIGGQIKFCGSGTIIETNCSENVFTSIVLTSASVIPDLKNSGIAEVEVRLDDGIKIKSKLLACDRHYNLAVIEINVPMKLQTATLQWVIDTVSIDGCSSELCSDRSARTLSPGDRITMLGRYSFKDCEIMAAPGTFIMDILKFDCQELLCSTCKITKCGIGGPVVNSHMEVVGVAFYSGKYTPFLPINVAMKWWEAVKLNRKLCHPSLGIQPGDLLLGDLDFVGDLLYKFPDAKGLVVLKVVPSSVAQVAGIHEGDVMMKCDGKVLSSSLELFEAIWDKAGTTVGLDIVRANIDHPFHVKLTVEDVPVEKFNSWPLPKEYIVQAHRTTHYEYRF